LGLKIRTINDSKYLIAQIKNNQIIDFHDKQAILEIFDVDEIIIPDQGILHNENFTNLDIVDEIWKPVNIKGTIYQVSNMGRIEIMRKTFGSTTSDGYKQVGISSHPFLVHRLVMTAFNGVIGDGLVVNHIESDRTNNRLDNLEITTYSGNSVHAVVSGSKSQVSVR